ncbi:outer membrane beta-barrel protein [Daejeonella oryzae]|uniref:outer membrane beta-barrel protein n=1 Tax=Daejeonella oryzae TaxID=1122943 RepID=UPI00041B496A|nr:outer membrane beta-barrel protein [Daejeonella oryzae]
MKTVMTTILIACIGIHAANAQTQKGNVMWGASVSNIGLDFQKGNTGFSMDLTPKIGYFIKDDLAVGPEIALGVNTNDGSTVFTYRAGGFGRYFLSNAEVTEVVRGSRWFLEANAGLTGTNVKVKGLPSTNTNGLGIGFGPGLAYFVTDRISLEGLLKYNLGVGFGNATTTNRVNLGIGFQIYLPGKQLKDRLTE